MTMVWRWSRPLPLRLLLKRRKQLQWALQSNLSLLLLLRKLRLPQLMTMMMRKTCMAKLSILRELKNKTMDSSWKRESKWQKLWSSLIETSSCFTTLKLTDHGKLVMLRTILLSSQKILASLWLTTRSTEQISARPLLQVDSIWAWLQIKSLH